MRDMSWFGYDARGRVWLGAGLAIVIACFAASPFDMAVSDVLHQPGSIFGVAVQKYGTLYAAPLCIGAIVLLSITRLRRRWPRCSTAASAVLIQLLAHSAFFVTALKLLWGRVRFIDLSPERMDFTPFYLPAFGAGGASFPSGHVATALALLPAVYLLSVQGFRKAAVLLGFGVAVWAGIIGCGRLVYGAHYLTDVLFAVGSAVAMTPLSVRMGQCYLRAFEK